MNENDRLVTVFTMLVHGLFHTYELSIPIFLVIWLDVFGVSEAVLGAVVSVGYALIGVGALPSGLLADRYGSRTLIVLSVIGMGGGFFLFSLASDLLLIGFAIVVWGIAASVYHPAGLSLISRSADDRGAVFGYHGVGGNVGTAFGPLVVTLLLVFLDWRWVVRLLVVPAVVVLVLGYTVDFDETTANGDGDGDGDERISVRSVLGESRLLFTAGFTVAFAVVMLYGVYYRGLLTFLPNVISNLPRFDAVTVFNRTAEPAQYIYVGLLTVGILGQYAGGHATNHVRTEHALLGALTVLSVVTFAFLPASAAGVLPFLAVCALIGFCLYAAAPIYQVLIAEYAASDVHGLSYGYTYLGMFGVGAAGAALAGTLLARFDAQALLLALGCVSIVATGLVALALRLPASRSETTAASDAES